MVWSPASKRFSFSWIFFTCPERYVCFFHYGLILLDHIAVRTMFWWCCMLYCYCKLQRVKLQPSSGGCGLVGGGGWLEPHASSLPTSPVAVKTALGGAGWKQGWVEQGGGLGRGQYRWSCNCPYPIPLTLQVWMSKSTQTCANHIAVVGLSGAVRTYKASRVWISPMGCSEHHTGLWRNWYTGS